MGGRGVGGGGEELGMGGCWRGGGGNTTMIMQVIKVLRGGCSF